MFSAVETSRRVCQGVDTANNQQKNTRESENDDA